MPNKDAVLEVGPGGTAESGVLPAVFLHNFSLRMDPAFTFSFSVTDEDNYPIADTTITGQTTLTGPQAVPVMRKLKNIIFRLSGATPGRYELRAYVD